MRKLQECDETNLIIRILLKNKNNFFYFIVVFNIFIHPKHVSLTDLTDVTLLLLTELDVWPMAIAINACAITEI